ncbi:SDR family oxidoreductase [Candidatus Pelagibacter sp.]|nr:SDR family oxidoreductase [Candidatus Pelagibacter sp.]
MNFFLKNYNLEKKCILITGAAGLLGKQFSIALLEAGAKVIMTDINQNSLLSFKKKLVRKFKSKNIVYYKLDVSSEYSIKSVLKKLAIDKIKIDVLINNACLNPKFDKNFGFNDTFLENYSILNWEKEIKVGLTGSFLCAKHFGYSMKKNKKKGIIINIGSELSVVAPDHRIYKKNTFKPVTYSVIKHGIIGLTKYISTYWAKDGIRCNALSPGGVFENQDKKFVKKFKDLVPLKKMASINEYNSAIQFLCSDASKFLNGHNLIMDGGRTVW